MEIPVCHRSSTPSGREERNTKGLRSHLQKNLAATSILHPSVYFYFMKYVGLAPKFLLVGRRRELKQRHKKTPFSVFSSPLVYPSIRASFHCQTPTHVSFFPFSCSAQCLKKLTCGLWSTSDDHAVHPAAHNTGRPSCGWVSPPSVPSHNSPVTTIGTPIPPGLWSSL